MDKYRSMQNAFALGQVVRSAEIPSPDLAIGPAENLAPSALMIYQDVWNREENAIPVNPTVAETPIEKVGVIGQGQTVYKSDFAGGFWLGDPIGGTV